MNEEEIKKQIDSLKATLTGDLFEDMGTQQEIYELKKKLRNRRASGASSVSSSSAYSPGK